MVGVGAGGGSVAASRVASRARALWLWLRPRLVLHSAALNNHANKSHLHFPAAAVTAAGLSLSLSLRRGAAGTTYWPICRYRTRRRRRWRPPGVVDPRSRRHWHSLFIYERVLAWNVWQANKYVKVRARRANVNMGSFFVFVFVPKTHPLSIQYVALVKAKPKANYVNVSSFFLILVICYYALASATADAWRFFLSCVSVRDNKWWTDYLSTSTIDYPHPRSPILDQINFVFVRFCCFPTFRLQNRFWPDCGAKNPSSSIFKTQITN